METYSSRRDCSENEYKIFGEETIMLAAASVGHSVRFVLQLTNLKFAMVSGTVVKMGTRVTVQMTDPNTGEHDKKLKFSEGTPCYMMKRN